VDFRLGLVGLEPVDDAVRVPPRGQRGSHVSEVITAHHMAEDIARSREFRRGAGTHRLVQRVHAGETEAAVRTRALDGRSLGDAVSKRCASGVLVAPGAPAYLLGFGIAQLVSTAAWPIAILGSVSLGVGLAGPGYRLWRTPATSDLVSSDESTPV
jgi:hypothetical protein